MRLDTQDVLSLTVKDLTGERVFVSGVSGSGKSNTVGVLIEEFLAHMPVTIIDPAGEYWGLREQFEALIVGQSDHADFDVDIEQVSKLAEYAYLNGIPVIIDLLGKKLAEQRALLERYLETIWELATVHRRPHQIVLEEAPQFIPQSGKLTPFKDLTTLIALQGRKFGLGLITVAQRPSMVHKDIITQSGLYIFHRQTYETDIRKYAENIPLSKTEVWEQAPRLADGQAFVVYKHQSQVVQIRERQTFHAGATPDLESTTIPTLRKVDASLIAELQHLLQPPHESLADTKQEYKDQQLQRLIKEKDQQIATLKASNKKLKRQLSIPLPAGKPNPTVATGRAVQRAKERQKKRFSQLLRVVKRLPKHEREVLGYLMTVPNAALTSQKLSVYLGYSRNRVSKSPPMTLLKLELLGRHTGKTGFTYTAQVDHTLANQFPLLDLSRMVDELATAL